MLFAADLTRKSGLEEPEAAAQPAHRYDLLLTARELEVARLAAQGMRNGEIAQQLFVSENTVKKHLQIVFRKLNIDRRSMLAAKLPHA